MNKTLHIVFIIIALLLVAYNVTLIDFEKPLQGNSTVAIIGIIAPFCAILLLLIYRTSKKIQEKIDKKG
ncbi:hypothetical protein [Pareuzebyella sediminis]|uniref:hypothetical protein n=1 Tax=Pareuzebyella sediminis TaxID=2607998 RepID=UPI0011ED97FD|nr:hypothetical protein [Pareuzebyella sediminis]